MQTKVSQSQNYLNECVFFFNSQELVVMGAPGSYYWTGTIKVYNLTSDSFYSPNKEDVDSHRYSYLGKSLLMS